MGHAAIHTPLSPLRIIDPAPLDIFAQLEKLHQACNTKPFQRVSWWSTSHLKIHTVRDSLAGLKTLSRFNNYDMY
ncbi:hypothetical protein E2C01_050339 [Portunus trituberculatus]|uniref:Uncharacterized protein n=1 Tax=Portunus trituberculatus TaxID=210409 RepID=A0A5B7GH14_PORTR|nr:hypothetical protein [Portunus trituberculatus]